MRRIKLASFVSLGLASIGLISTTPLLINCGSKAPQLQEWTISQDEVEKIDYVDSNRSGWELYFNMISTILNKSIQNFLLYHDEYNENVTTILLQEQNYVVENKVNDFNMSQTNIHIQYLEYNEIDIQDGTVTYCVCSNYEEVVGWLGQ